MKLIYYKGSKTFSTRVFSDWDQIRNLVNDNLPKGVIRIEKVKGSETDKSYQIVPVYRGNKKGKPVEVPINGKSALDNYNKATGSKIENPLRSEFRKEGGYENWRSKQVYVPDVSRKPNAPKYLLRQEAKRDRFDKEIVAMNPNTPEDVLRKLSNEENDRIKLNLISNSSTPMDVIEKFLKDSSDEVRKAANNRLSK